MLQKEFHTSLSENFVKDIQNLTNFYYYFIGRTYPFPNGDVVPAQKVYTTDELKLIRTDSLYYQKIQPADVSLVIPRYNWASGTVYDMWDNTAEMSNLEFFVVTYDIDYSRYNVYKCLDNNNSGTSTVQPTGVSPYVQKLSDGYVWKYMYSITETLIDSFGSSTKIPVRTAMSSHFYNKGSISSISILDGGTGYANTDVVNIVGDGTGAEANLIVVDGVITDIQMISMGQGYTYASVSVTSGTGSACRLKAVVEISAYETEQAIVEQLAVDGSINAVKVVSGGTYYSSDTTVSIVGDGTGATASLTIVSGVIKKVNMTSYGSGYTYANVVITDPNELSRPSNAANFSGYAILPPNGGHGKNAVTELYASEVCVSTQIPIMTFGNANDFRQIGIVKNPTYLSSGKYFKDVSQLVCYKVLFDTVNNLSIDSVLTSNSSTDNISTYRVIYFDSVRKEVLLKPLTKNSKTPTALINGSQSYSVQNIISSPTLDRYSGEMLYVSNNSPFATVTDQTITLKTNIIL